MDWKRKCQTRTLGSRGWRFVLHYLVQKHLPKDHHRNSDQAPQITPSSTFLQLFVIDHVIHSQQVECSKMISRLQMESQDSWPDREVQRVLRLRAIMPRSAQGDTRLYPIL